MSRYTENEYLTGPYYLHIDMDKIDTYLRYRMSTYFYLYTRK